MTEKELIEKARQASTAAYAPYSHFRVGAALLAENGEVFTGVNVENSSYGLTICAERNALAAAICRGIRSFTMIAVYADADPPVTPCGACRQVLYEFAPAMKVVCANDKGDVSRFTVAQLLPDGFGHPHDDGRV